MDMSPKESDILITVDDKVNSFNSLLFRDFWIFISKATSITCDIFIEEFFGPGSSVGIATDYGLDSPGSNPGGDEIFRPSRPALGPT